MFPNLKVITQIYGESQMSANFWYYYTVWSNFCFDDFKNQYFSAFCPVLLIFTVQKRKTTPPQPFVSRDVPFVVIKRVLAISLRKN
jgi:hypothetical protein